MNNGKARILIADDNEQIHKDFKLILNPSTDLIVDEEQQLDDLLGEVLNKSISSAAKENQFQFELDFAFQGDEAEKMVSQAYYEQKPYAVVFMDVRMPPGRNGIDTIQSIWKKHPQTEMVICTAYSDYSWEDISDVLGISHRLLLLKKPFDNMEVKKLALSLSMKSNYYKKYQQHISELESAVKSRTKELEIKEQEISRHRDNLQQRVNEQTHELIQARDLANAANKSKSEFLLNFPLA